MIRPTCTENIRVSVIKKIEAVIIYDHIVPLFLV